MCERHLVPTWLWFLLPACHLMSTCLRILGEGTPPYSSRLLVPARLYLPYAHTPHSAHTPPSIPASSGIHALLFSSCTQASWCQQVFRLLRLSVFACLLVSVRPGLLLFTRLNSPGYYHSLLGCKHITSRVPTSLDYPYKSVIRNSTADSGYTYGVSCFTWWVQLFLAYVYSQALQD